jgi:hypothetical protein
MAKKIIEMVRAKRDELKGDHAAAEKFAGLAVAAINDGIKSRAWETYMFQFVEKDPNDNTKPLDPAQLARLLADDGSFGDPLLNRKRGYLLSNGMCGAGSPDTANLAFSVNTIDQGLTEDCEDQATAGNCVAGLNVVVNSSGNASAESATPAAGAQGGPTAESPKP